MTLKSKQSLTADKVKESNIDGGDQDDKIIINFKDSKNVLQKKTLT